MTRVLSTTSELSILAKARLEPSFDHQSSDSRLIMSEVMQIRLNCPNSRSLFERILIQHWIVLFEKILDMNREIQSNVNAVELQLSDAFEDEMCL